MSVQTVFKVVGSYTNFYTGGPISLFSTEEKLICSCGDAIKVVDLQTAEVVKTLEGVCDFISINPVLRIVVLSQHLHLILQTNILLVVEQINN